MSSPISSHSRLTATPGRAARRCWMRARSGSSPPCGQSACAPCRPRQTAALPSIADRSVPEHVHRLSTTADAMQNSWRTGATYRCRRRDDHRARGCSSMTPSKSESSAVSLCSLTDARGGLAQQEPGRVSEEVRPLKPRPPGLPSGRRGSASRGVRPRSSSQIDASLPDGRGVSSMAAARSSASPIGIDGSARRVRWR